MNAAEAIALPAVRTLVDDLTRELGDRLRSVVLYGSAARGDYQERTSDLNLLLVLNDLDAAALDALAAPLARWRRRGQPLPRLFTAELIAASADVFPIEFLDLQRHRVVVTGDDPLAGVEIRRDHLRLQCERELREKLMRLREGYLEAGGRPKELKRLLTGSYTTFLALFRGCLHLLGGEVPVHNEEVVEAFCARAGLDPLPFREIDRLKRGGPGGPGPAELFARYYDEIRKAVRRVDRFQPPQGGAA